ncbi:MAG: hypothetical protein R6U92_04080 [Bacillota bacterium]
MRFGVKKRIGLIVERGDGWAVVLTPGGDFRRITLSGTEPGVGERVAIPGNPLVGRLALVAAMVALIFLVVNLPFGASEEASAAAYLGVDLNPSWELALDSEGGVLGAVGFDRSAGELLERVEVSRGDDVVEVVMRLMENFEFSSEDERVLLTLAAAPRRENEDRGVSDEVLDSISSRLESLPAEIPVRILRVSDAEFRTRAREEGVSPGIYARNLLEEEVAAEIGDGDEDAISEGVSRALEEAGAGDRVIEAMRRRFERGPGGDPPADPPGRDREDEEPGREGGPPPDRGKPEAVPPADPPASSRSPEESGNGVPNRSEEEFAPPGWQRRTDGTFTPPGRAGRR